MHYRLNSKEGWYYHTKILFYLRYGAARRLIFDFCGISVMEVGKNMSKRRRRRKRVTIAGVTFDTKTGKKVEGALTWPSVVPSKPKKRRKKKR